MISVPDGTGDIADAMISASQMIYASRMKERILYHACEASISYGVSRISYRVSDISLKCVGFLWYYLFDKIEYGEQFDKLEFDE